MRPVLPILAVALGLIVAYTVAEVGTAADPFPNPAGTTFRVTAPVAYGPLPSPTARPLPVATPNPLSYECDGLEYKPWRSYFTNPTFDNGFPDDAPFGWTGFRTPTATYGEEYSYLPFGPNVRITGTGAFRAGIFQTVPTVPGRWYHAWYATAQEVFGGPGGGRDGSLPILREIGADLGGGTNPDSPAILWGRPIGGQPDKDAKQYGGWKTLGAGNAPLVSFKATGQKSTIFFRASGWPDVTRSTTWFDSAFIVDACQGGYRPIGAPPTPSP